MPRLLHAPSSHMDGSVMAALKCSGYSYVVVGGVADEIVWQ